MHKKIESIANFNRKTKFNSFYCWSYKAYRLQETCKKCCLKSDGSESPHCLNIDFMTRKECAVSRSIAASIFSISFFHFIWFTSIWLEWCGTNRSTPEQRKWMIFWTMTLSDILVSWKFLFLFIIILVILIGTHKLCQIGCKFSQFFVRPPEKMNSSDEKSDFSYLHENFTLKFIKLNAIALLRNYFRRKKIVSCAKFRVLIKYSINFLLEKLMIGN